MKDIETTSYLQYIYIYVCVCVCLCVCVWGGGDLDVDGWIILGRISRRWNGLDWAGPG